MLFERAQQNKRKIEIYILFFKRGLTFFYYDISEFLVSSTIFYSILINLFFCAVFRQLAVSIYNVRDFYQSLLTLFFLLLILFFNCEELL
jgi:hypothetical protein